MSKTREDEDYAEVMGGGATEVRQEVLFSKFFPLVFMLYNTVFYKSTLLTEQKCLN